MSNFTDTKTSQISELHKIYNEYFDSDKDGFFVAFTPNGSKYHREKNKNWDKLWGMVHLNFLDENFYKNYFKDYKYYITSSPFNGDSIKKFVNSDNIYCDELSGEELLIIVKNK